MSYFIRNADLKQLLTPLYDGDYNKTDLDKLIKLAKRIASDYLEHQVKTKGNVKQLCKGDPGKLHNLVEQSVTNMFVPSKGGDLVKIKKYLRNHVVDPDRQDTTEIYVLLKRLVIKNTIKTLKRAL